MRSDCAAIVLPFGQCYICLVQRCKQGFVQAFVAHFATEALHKATLHRLAWGNVVPRNTIVLSNKTNQLTGCGREVNRRQSLVLAKILRRIAPFRSELAHAVAE